MLATVVHQGNEPLLYQFARMQLDTQRRLLQIEAQNARLQEMLQGHSAAFQELRGSFDGLNRQVAGLTNRIQEREVAGRNQAAGAIREYGPIVLEMIREHAAANPVASEANPVTSAITS